MQYAMLRALKNTFIYHFTMGAVTLVGFTPARLAGPVGRMIGRLAHLLAKPERRLALHHLGRTLDSSQSKNRARLLTRGVFIELARNTVELCHLRNTPDKLPNVVFSKASRRALEDALSKPIPWPGRATPSPPLPKKATIHGLQHRLTVSEAMRVSRLSGGAALELPRPCCGP